MKNYFKFLVPALIVATASCTKEDDTSLPGQIVNPVFSEDFERPAGEAPFNFQTNGQPWTNFAEAGTKTWILNQYQGAHYLEFSSFGTNQASNIGWIITPEIDLTSALEKRMVFQSAQHHATDLGNKFEVLVSSDFDGTNVLAAHWTAFPFRLPTYANSENYTMVNSGIVDLSQFTGPIHIAFRVKGDGLPNSNFDGGFEVDNIKVF
ncbi:MAG: DUF5017 domain-containing protein [Flavobacterium sp.]|nr:MAG: DUF5017 domain-containing protein [Flavobacterium sp.]